MIGLHDLTRCHWSLCTDTSDPLDPSFIFIGVIVPAVDRRLDLYATSARPMESLISPQVQPFSIPLSHLWIFAS